MKILMINHFPLAGSGSGTYTKNLSVHLAALGHEVCVILPENTPDYERVEGIRIHPVYFSPCDGAPGLAAAPRRDDTVAIKARQTVGAPGASPEDALPFNFPCFTSHPRSVTTFADLNEAELAQYTAAFSAAIEEEIAADRPDIIHGQHVWILPALAAGHDIPLVLTAHGTDLMGFDKWPHLRRFAQTAMDACSAVISISKDNCALLEERFPEHKDKVVMMRNGYDPGVFYPEELSRDEVLRDFAPEAERYRGIASGEAVLVQSPDTKRQHGGALDAQASRELPPDYGVEAGAWRGRRIVLFAGKLAHFKGVDILLDAVKMYEEKEPATLTLIVGDGDERDALHAQARDLGLASVRFLGNVDQQALRRLYNIADVSLVPSRREPFGLVAIEAMACGIPVIASDQGGLPDFVNESVGALVEPEDAKELAAVILATLAREEKTDTDAWRRDIAAYARTHYAQDMIIKELETLYTKALTS